MAAPAQEWYLKEWLLATRTTSATLERETGWTHRIASQLVNCRIRWNRDHLLLAAQVLRIEPFELLIDPDLAFHIRRLRQSVSEEHRLQLVAEDRRTFTPPPEQAERLMPVTRRK